MGTRVANAFCAALANDERSRYDCTMVQGERLWQCMKYIDLNVVGAGVVRYPSEWEWCGYRELMGRRRRYRILDVKELQGEYGGCPLASLRTSYANVVAEAIGQRPLRRELIWTDSIAAGNESFVKAVAAQTCNRVQLTVESSGSGCWSIREA